MSLLSLKTVLTEALQLQEQSSLKINSFMHVEELVILRILLFAKDIVGKTLENCILDFLIFSIIDQLKVTGRLMGCYKIILDCSVKNVPFYEKCGFVEKEREMALYYGENDASLQIDTGKIKSNL